MSNQPETLRKKTTNDHILTKIGDFENQQSDGNEKVKKKKRLNK